MKRRKIDLETKMAAVLEGLKGESSVAEICRKYQISESLYYRWRDKFLEGGSRACPHFCRLCGEYCGELISDQKKKGLENHLSP
jgi:transposase-like protein